MPGGPSNTEMVRRSASAVFVQTACNGSLDVVPRIANRRIPVHLPLRPVDRRHA